MIVEKDTWFINGYISSFVIALLLFVAFLNIFHQQLVISVISFVLAIVLITGLTIVQPNQIIVVMFLGTYIGTIRKAGFMMTVPLTSKVKVSRKIQRFETENMHIQHAPHRPIQLSAVITYQIVDAAKALFTVDKYTEYMEMEAYLLTNNLATEKFKENKSVEIISLNEEIKQALQTNVQFAGIDILEVHCVPIDSSTSE